MKALKPGMQRGEWAVRVATGAEYSASQTNTVIRMLKGLGEGSKAMKARVVQEGSKSQACYRKLKR